MMMYKISQIFFFILCTLPTAIYSAAISKPNTFTNGTTASAAQVNANFDTLYTQVNLMDTRGTSGGAGENPSTDTCPTNYILVPGDTVYGTTDFCVMKYEAKSGPKGATSKPLGLPMRGVIAFSEAYLMCKNLGPGYALINNNEWMTIATNIANVPNNWDGQVVGTNAINRGHSDNTPGVPLAADANDINACAGTGQACDNTVTWDPQRRTHELSNGNYVWDFAGNVYEYVDMFIYESKIGALASFQEISLYTAGNNTDHMTITDIRPLNANHAFWNDAWNSTEGMGQYYAGTNSSGGAALRGGYWSTGAIAGVFTLYLNNAPSNVGTNIGFRCVFRK